MKIIFLDINGVIDTNWKFGQKECDLDLSKLKILKRIIDNTNAKIVLSSTWRINVENRRMIIRLLKSCDMSLHDYTPLRKHNEKRCVEIKEWLSYYPKVKKYAILDDNNDACVQEESESFFKTNCYDGLTDHIADKIISHLNS